MILRLATGSVEFEGLSECVVCALCKKERISARALRHVVERACQGLIDADLGGGVIKQRIARVGAGRSSGYRAIILFVKDERAFLVYGFSKSAVSNISPAEEKQFRTLARHVLALTDWQLSKLLESGQFEEVANNG